MALFSYQCLGENVVIQVSTTTWESLKLKHLASWVRLPEVGDSQPPFLRTKKKSERDSIVLASSNCGVPDKQLYWICYFSLSWPRVLLKTVPAFMLCMSENWHSKDSPLRETIPLDSVSVLSGARGDKGVNMCNFTFRQNGTLSPKWRYQGMKSRESKL